MRIDVFLSEHNLAETRTRAKNLIEMQMVKVNDTIVTKPSFNVSEFDKIEIIDNYAASLGSIKLNKAIEAFNLNIFNKVCVDLGASNGGFTEILLINGAKKVYAVDIGECAFPERLKKNEKIIVMDKTNARDLTIDYFEEYPDFICGDLSFISLKLILPVAKKILKKNGEAIFLIKPQFETNKKNIPKSGVIKDKNLQQKIVKEIEDFSNEIGFTVIGTTEAPHPFPDKNQEFLIYLIN